MAKTDASPSPEAVTRAFLHLAIPKLPEAVSQRMLADSIVLAALGLPTDAMIRLWNQRFSRSAVFDCLRDIANGKDASLTSMDGKVRVEEARLDDGAAVLRVGTEAVRFINVDVLGNDLAQRQRGVDRIVAKGDMSVERESIWRQAVAMGPLDDELFLALQVELGATPEASFQEMESDIADGSATFDDMVPPDAAHYAGLLGPRTPSVTLGAFKTGWLAHAETLDEARLVRLLRLSGPLSVMAGGLVAQASDRLPPKARLKLVTYLQSRADPFSVVAAFEIACRHRAHSEMRAIADALVPRLFDRTDPLIEHGGAALVATLVLTTAVTARNRTLADWPLHLRRLARFVHAGHLVRVFRGASVDPALFNEEVARTFFPHARLAELCDMREAPTYQASHLSAALVHGLVASRVSEAIAGIEEGERPAEWVAAGQAGIAADTDDGNALYLFAPGPFDELEPDWKGRGLYPTEIVEDLRVRLDSGDDQERSLSDLIKLAVAFEVPAEHRAAIAAALPPFIQTQSDGHFLMTAEIGLELAARWRDVDLSDHIVVILLERAQGDGLADAGAAPRLVMLAAAAVEARDDWLERAGILARQFAFAQKPGVPSINLQRALDILRDMEPDLGRAVAQARAFATLTFDRLP